MRNEPRLTKLAAVFIAVIKTLSLIAEAGYDSTPENTAKLISLTREQEGLPKTPMDRNEQK